MKKLIYTFFLAFGLMSCENDAQLYEGEPGGFSGIYFYSRMGTQVADSMEYSFQNDPLEVKRKEVPLPIKVLGYTADYPRPFSIKVIGGDAVAGKDYEALAEEYIIPAGKAEYRFPLILLRTEDLLKKKKHVILELQENEHFKLLLPEAQEVNTTRFKVIFSELITKPQMWDITYAATHFGNWSVNKFRLINDLMGWQVSDWSNYSGPVQPGKYAYAATLLYFDLQKKADAKTPEYEDDGVTYMQLPPPNTVDYSKLEEGK